MASVCARVARALQARFMPWVREMLHRVGVLHVDETEGGLHYVHIAAAPYLTALHTGGRAKADIDASEVLIGLTGTIVRDGYAGTAHLINAHHASCGAHLLRDLRAFHQADPAGQLWAAAMADTLISAHSAARDANASGQAALEPQPLATIYNHYRGAAAKGIADNSTRARARWPPTRWPSSAASRHTKT